MTEETALQLVHRLNAAGYRVSIGVYPPIEDHLMPGEDVHNRQPTWHVSIAEMGVDKVDVKALVAIADELGLDCGYHQIKPFFSFDDPDTRAMRPRSHPR